MSIVLCDYLPIIRERSHRLHKNSSTSILDRKAEGIVAYSYAFLDGPLATVLTIYRSGQVRSGSRIVRRPLRRSSTVTAVDSLSP